MKSLSRFQPKVCLTITAHLDTGEIVGSVDDYSEPGIPRSVDRREITFANYDSLVDQFLDAIGEMPDPEPDADPRQRHLHLIGGTDA